MATVECLACGQDNSADDESCAACSSSLNLKLCAGCEAINAQSAERCHGCGIELDIPAQPTQKARGARFRFKVALWALPLLAAASVSYYFAG